MVGLRRLDPPYEITNSGRRLEVIVGDFDQPSFTSMRLIDAGANVHRNEAPSARTSPLAGTTSFGFSNVLWALSVPCVSTIRLADAAEASRSLISTSIGSEA